MRRVALLLMVMATALLVASGVAWAVDKVCPPTPKKCYGTNGQDWLSGTRKNNYMIGKRGWDIYYLPNALGGKKTGNDVILDTGGRDELHVAWTRSEAKGWDLDVNNNGKYDAYRISGPRASGASVTILGYYDDTRSKRPFYRGPGYIEKVEFFIPCTGFECPTP
jgi:hypothetical protein